jgi:hypothetical protein
MTDQDAENNPTRKRLLALAQEFYYECEAPSQEDMTTLFKLLINRRLSALERFVTDACAHSAIRHAEKDM